MVGGGLRQNDGNAVWGWRDGALGRGVYFLCSCAWLCGSGGAEGLVAGSCRPAGTAGVSAAQGAEACVPEVLIRAYAGRLVWSPVPRVDWRFSPVSTRLSVAAIPLAQGCIKSFLLLCTGLVLWYSHISRAMDAAAVPPAKRAGQCPFFTIGGIFPVLALLPSRTASKERLNASEQQLSPRSSSCQGQRA